MTQNNTANESKLNESELEQSENKIVKTFHGSIISLNGPHEEEEKCHSKFLTIVLDIIKEMTDFKLLVQNFGFLLITISNFFLFLGYFTPFLYLVKVATENGASNSNATFLLSIIGIYFLF